MARNITTNANVVITMNGKQAKSVIAGLERDAKRLKDELDKATAAGDTKGMRRAAKELNRVNGQLAVMRTNTVEVADVMKRLDRATPKELQKTLNTLKNQLNGIERGSDAWRKHVEKIRLVDAELRNVNQSIGVQRSRWDRLNIWLNNTQTALMGIIAAFTGVVMAGREAVKKFADMDEQLANTRKYTGMTVMEVGKLNETFSNMNTRTTREQLNALAQEAGRLGKNTLDSVRGYVEAADIVNVALVDLGEGATQTISKIANIFGVEKQLGTKRALLSIGSAVNVLSQNCTASKPYLVEFAQRMAGIGAQAGLTVPQILAFGAVLDSNGQKVEMSATALQKIIMALANKNKEFSSVLGLDAEKLAQTLQRSAKDGILMYLSAIKRLSDETSAGNATMALAPLFKDMGMDAARVATVLSTLANHIGEVRWQLKEADKAFGEATSASNEYFIFNNTAQAKIDRAKKKLSELTIELGEKLYPIMTHVYTSTSLMVRMLSTVISFVDRNKKSILLLVTAIAAYKVTMLACNAVMKVAQIRAALLNGTLAVQNINSKALAKSTLLLSAAHGLLQGNVAKAQMALALFNKTAKFNVIGILVAVVGALVTKFIMARNETDEYTKSLNEASNRMSEFRQEAMKEQHELDNLFNKLRYAEKGSKQYRDAKQQIINQYSMYLKGLINERGEIINLTQAYNQLTYSIQEANKQKGIKVVKAELENVYLKEVDEISERIRVSMERMGAPEWLSDQIAIKITDAYATPGRGLDSSVRNIMKSYWGIMSGRASHLKLENPLELLDDLDKKKSKFVTRYDKLDVIDGSNYENVPTEHLDELRGLLEKQLNQSPLTLIEVPMPSNNWEQKTRGSWVNGNRTNSPVIGLENIDPIQQNRLLNPDYDEDVVDRTKTKDEEYVINILPTDFINYTYDPLRDISKRKSNGKGRGNDSDDEDETVENNTNMVKLGRGAAEQFLIQIRHELGNRSQPEKTDIITDIPEYVPEKEQAKEDRRMAAAARAEAAKAKREFKEGMDALKAEYLEKDKEVVLSYAAGQVDYLTYLERRNEAEQVYFDKLRYFYIDNLSTVKDLEVEEDKDYQAVMKRREEAQLKYEEKVVEFKRGRIRKSAQFEEEQAKADFKSQERSVTQEVSQIEQVKLIRLNALKEQQDLLRKGSKEWEDLQLQIEQESEELSLSIDRVYEKRVFELKQEYLKRNAEMRINAELEVLQKLLDMEKLTLEEYLKIRRQLERKYEEERLKERGAVASGLDVKTGDTRGKSSSEVRELWRRSAEDRDAKIDQVRRSVDEGVLSEEEGEERIASIKNDFFSNFTDALRSSKVEWLTYLADLGGAWTKLWNGLGGDSKLTLENIAEAAQATFAVVTAGMQLASQFAQVNAQIAQKRIEARYERESELAQGNTYLTTKLEKEKQRELAKVQNEASEKSMAMQVISAIAQSVQGAMNAYTSTAAIPVVGPVLAPAAAAVAASVGAANVALVVKQKEAAKSQGYADGGFTPDGGKYEVAGVVHKGEWVASRELVRSPVARPILNYLEQAQRENRIGSLTHEDAVRVVSRAAVVQPSADRGAAPAQVTVEARAADSEVLAELSAVVGRLARRLDEPIRADVSVTGRNGIREKLDEYERLLNNKNIK